MPYCAHCRDYVVWGYTPVTRDNGTKVYVCDCNPGDKCYEGARVESSYYNDTGEPTGAITHVPASAWQQLPPEIWAIIDGYLEAMYREDIKRRFKKVRGQLAYRRYPPNGDLHWETTVAWRDYPTLVYRPVLYSWPGRTQYKYQSYWLVRLEDSIQRKLEVLWRNEEFNIIKHT